MTHEAEGVNFVEALRRGVADWNWRGRGSRSEYWWLVLGVALLSVALSLFSHVRGLSYLVGACWVFAEVVLVKAMVRRYHDIGRSAKWAILQTGIWMVCSLVVVLGLVAIVASALGGGFSGRANVFYHIGIVGLGIEVANGIWALVWLCARGEKGENRWG